MSRSPRWYGALAAIAIAASGCYLPHYTKRRVADADLGQLRRAGRTSEIILHSPEGEPIRLGPRSYIRFQRTDGSFTQGYEASDLSVSEEGVTSPGVPNDDAVIQIRVTGLGAPRAAILAEIAPRSASLVPLPGRSYDLVGSNRALFNWVRAYVKEMDALKKGEQPNQTRLGAAGEWRALGLRGWGPPTDGDLLGNGFLLPDGLRWEEITGVEIAYVDGKTLGTSALLTGAFTLGAAAAGIIGAGMQAGGGLARMSGASGSSNGSRSSGGSSGGGVGEGIGTGVLSDAPPFGPRDPAERASLVENNRVPSGTRKMFSIGMRIRGMAQPVLALESGGDLRQHDELGTNAVLSVRAIQAIEVGGGVRQIWRRGSVENPERSYGGFLHLGIAFDLDVARRVTIPVAYDLGGVNRAGVYMKFAAGVRVRVAEKLSVGLYPFNPVYTGTSHRSSGWNFPTTLELGYLF